MSCIYTDYSVIGCLDRKLCRKSRDFVVTVKIFDPKPKTFCCELEIIFPVSHS